jgi:hypothetical protein
VSDHLNLRELDLLNAARADRLTAVGAEYAIDGRLVVAEDVKELIAVLVLEKYLDVDLDGTDDPKRIELTGYGRDALERHEQESRR